MLSFISFLCEPSRDFLIWSEWGLQYAISKCTVEATTSMQPCCQTRIWRLSAFAYRILCQTCGVTILRIPRRRWSMNSASSRKTCIKAHQQVFLMPRARTNRIWALLLQPKLRISSRQLVHSQGQSIKQKYLILRILKIIPQMVRIPPNPPNDFWCGTIEMSSVDTERARVQFLRRCRYFYVNVPLKKWMWNFVRCPQCSVSVVSIHEILLVTLFQAMHAKPGFIACAHDLYFESGAESSPRPRSKTSKHTGVSKHRKSGR